MGAAASAQANPETKKDLKKAVDYIASEYILTQNFTDMKKLANPEYCDNLVILTSRVIADNLTDQDVSYLSRRVEDGMEINSMETDKVIYAKRKSLDKLDVKSKPTKERMCIGIAKFYVKIAHLFAAIMTTVNPRYSYTDPSGVQQTETLQTRERVPTTTKPDVVLQTLCKRRYNALVNNQNFDINQNAKMVINPNFCGMNYDLSTGGDRDLTGEQGIPELESLYYDKYDYQTGKFDGMTDNMRTEVYNKDLLTFYQAFTGRKEIPKNSKGENTITRFSQIPLRDFHNSQGCVARGVFRAPQTGSLKEKLFREYAENAAKMLETTQTNQNKLLEVLDTIFAYRISPKTERREIVINPELNDESLQKVVELARNLIVELYVGCEKDFIKGLNIFESIVGKQILDTAVERERQLKNDVLEYQFVDDPQSPTVEPDSTQTVVGDDAPHPLQEDAEVPQPLQEDIEAPWTPSATGEPMGNLSFASTLTPASKLSPIPETSVTDESSMSPQSGGGTIEPMGEWIGWGALRVYH
jgi:hypothetical protein